MWPALWDWVEDNVSSFSAIEKKFISCSPALQAKKHLMLRISFVYGAARSRARVLTHPSPEPLSAKQRDMRGNYPPSLRQAHPGLALTAADDFAVFVSFELQVDAAKILSEGGYVEAGDAAGKVGRRPRGAESSNLLDAVQVLRRTETYYIRRRPEETLHRLDVVTHQCGFVFGIKSGKRGDGIRIVDFHS